MFQTVGSDCSTLGCLSCYSFGQPVVGNVVAVVGNPVVEGHIFSVFADVENIVVGGVAADDVASFVAIVVDSAVIVAVLFAVIVDFETVVSAFEHLF